MDKIWLLQISKSYFVEFQISQVGLKILTRPSTDFPLVYGDKNLLKK